MTSAPVTADVGATRLMSPGRASTPTSVEHGQSVSLENGLQSALGGERLAMTVATLGGIQIVAMFFTIARAKATAVFVGPAGVGAISVVDQLVNLVGQVVTFSLPFAATKFLSAAYSDGREAFARMYRSFAWALLTLTVGSATILTIGVMLKPSVLGRDLEPYLTLVIIGLATIPATTLVNFYIGTMASANRARTSGVYGLVNTVALALASAAGVVIAGVRGYYVGTLLAAFGVALAGALFIARREGARFAAPTWGVPAILRHDGIAGFAGSLYATSLALPAAHLMARLAVLRVAGFEAAGLLQSAMALGLALTLVMRQSNMLLLTPVLNRTAPTKNKLRDAADYLRVFSLTVGAAALPLVLFPDVWLYILYSRRFLAAAPYTGFFIFAQVLELFAGVALGLLVGIDRIATQLAITLAGLIVLAAAAWWLAPALGIAGVGIAFVAGAIIDFSLSIVAIRKTCDFRLLSAAGWGPILVIALIAIAATAAARYPGLSFEILAAKAVAGLVVGGCLALLARSRGAVFASASASRPAGMGRLS